MENIVIANPDRVFDLFAWGFLGGTLFGFIMMLIFQFITNRGDLSQENH